MIVKKPDLFWLIRPLSWLEHSAELLLGPMAGLTRGVPHGFGGQGVPVMKCHELCFDFSTPYDTSRHTLGHFAAFSGLCSERHELVID